MSSKLIEQLGYLGDSDIVQHLVEGRYDTSEELNNATTLIL